MHSLKRVFPPSPCFSLERRLPCRLSDHPSPGGPSATESATAAAWSGQSCVQGAGGNTVGKGIRTGHFGKCQIGKKNQAEELSCYSEGKSIAPSPLCRHQEMRLMIEVEIGLLALLLPWKMRRSRIVVWLASQASRHQLFSVTNGFVGHAEG